MTMLEIMKERLPEGLEIVRVRELAGRSKILFSYDGVEVTGYLPKTCAPGKETNVADFNIHTVMMEARMRKGDIDGAREWMAKQSALCTAE